MKVNPLLIEANAFYENNRNHYTQAQVEKKFGLKHYSLSSYRSNKQQKKNKGNIT